MQVHSTQVNRIFYHSRLPRCAFRRRIKFATGRTAPDCRLPTPDSLKARENCYIV
ncbi:hypothetical protein [Moorena bouillonii]|uniref:hypothetical protein n=1 Tax=Moorena bouillonii TaxID=207920 RepID=UPI001300D323|nr:hypothetical protein [Moorena bouillonii]NEQ86649.1 hypothetical protein [Moorena sp. SIO2I5]